MSQNNVLTDNKPPLVSICCLVYNHELYLKEALDSFLMQKTAFSFEVVIHDDASTDSSASIIKEYASKHPEIFKPLYQTENQKSKVKSGMNPRFNFPRAKGKYIAVCEGDDYWIDPYKLQKQVDFLEATPNLIATYHWQKVARFIDGAYVEQKAPKKGHGYINYNVTNVNHLFLNKVRLKSRTLLFRNIIDYSLFNVHFDGVAFGDVPLSYLLGQYGDFGFIDEEMAVYRLTGKGESTKGLKELGRLKFNVQHFKNWIEIWDRANNLYKYAYKKEAFSTVSSFYRVIFKNLPLRLQTLTHLLAYNHRRNLPLGMRLRRSFWIVKYFFKLVKQRLLAKLQ